MAKFLTIQGGNHTVNINFIAEVDWTTGEEEATVTMASGVEYTCEEEDYRALRVAMGLDVQGLEGLFDEAA